MLYYSAWNAVWSRDYQPARSGNDPAIPDTKHHFNSSTPFGKVKVARHQSHRLVGPLTLLQFSTTGFEVLQLGEENGISKLEEFLHPAGSRGEVLFESSYCSLGIELIVMSKFILPPALLAVRLLTLMLRCQEKRIALKTGTPKALKASRHLIF